MSLFSSSSTSRVLPGRDTPIETSDVHTINGHSLPPPFPEGHEEIVLGMGCFWGVERLFWQLPGVYVTAAGYAGGETPNPTYDETCTGRTGHTEVVRVVYDPKQVDLETLLQVDKAGKGQITTEIKPLEAFYYAEAYHQQYLDKNPNGYCGLKGTGVTCPIG